MINVEWDTVPLGSSVVVGGVDSSTMDGCVDSSVVNRSEVENS